MIRTGFKGIMIALLDLGRVSRQRVAALYPAFFDRAVARVGRSAFLGSCALVSSLAPRLRGFLPLAFVGGADCFSLARLRLSASIRLMMLPVDFGAGFVVVVKPLRFWLIR